MKNNDIAKSIEQQFGEIVDIILQHKSNASRVVNEELLLTAWHVGGYVSAKLRSEEWGSKVVSQLSEYIRSQRPDLKGYSKRSIYNMVMFYDEYSSETFIAAIKQYLNTEFVQTASAQIEAGNHVQESATIVQSMVTQIVQSTAGQMPKILELTTLSNHIEILCRCKSNEERIFYILYANKEHLSYKEMQRCISNQTYVGLLGNKDNMSKGLLERYPNAPILFKDTLFVDFLNLPKKHSESKLRNGLVEHMKQFILEMLCKGLHNISNRKCCRLSRMDCSKSFSVTKVRSFNPKNSNVTGVLIMSLGCNCMACRCTKADKVSLFWDNPLRS